MTFHSWSKSTCAALVLVLSCLLGPSAPASLPSANTGSSVQYLPFYGGAKGHYLEVKKDTKGGVISEKVVSEKQVSEEYLAQTSSDENVLSKVLTANLRSLQILSSDLLGLHHKGRNAGRLSEADRMQYRNDLVSLGETASNTYKLVEEIGDDVNRLFKKNSAQRKFDEEENVGEEGVSIDNPTDIDETLLGGTTIAEAKPFGLAVVGENGLAASRPHGTAVALTGVAIARPVATAIAGVDPTLLGINYNINSS